MDDKEFENILHSVETEQMCMKTYLCLKEDSVNGPHGQWGWSNSIETLAKHFAYGFVFYCIIMYNQKYRVDKIRDSVVLNIINNDFIKDTDLLENEVNFYNMWINVLKCKNFNSLQKKSKQLCQYLTKIGYKMNFILYDNPSKALPKALELEKYIPVGEFGMGTILKEYLKDEEY